nr:hypothetical protein [Tanacetum cinerariifolium]
MCSDFHRHNVTKLGSTKKQLDKEEFEKERPMAAFWVINKQFQMFIDSQFTWDYNSQIIEKYFVEYTGIDVKQFRETLLQQMGNVKKSVAERTRHKRQYDSRMNERQMQSKEGNVDSSKALDISLVVTECSAIESENINESSVIDTGKQDTSSSSENYITHAVDADIRPANDQVPFAEVQLTAQHNVLANEQQHTEQSELIYDTYLLKKTRGEAMINSIQNGDQPFPVIAQVSLAGNAQNAPPTLKDQNNETTKDLWDALKRQMRGSEYGEQDIKSAILY